MREKDKRGVTLVELMIVVAILSMVMAVIYGIYIYSVKASESHRLTSQLQMETRGALEYMTRELALMGHDVEMANCSGTGNDDGYPTYGNYGPRDAGPRIVKAASDEIVFTYKDTSVAVDGNLQQFRLVRYWRDGNEVKRRTARWLNTGVPADNQWAWQESEATLIENAVSMTFAFYNATGDNIPAGSAMTYADRCKVRRVKVELVAEQSKADPLTGTGTKKQYKLSTEVNLPNMGTSTVTDTTPPSKPTNVQVTDPHLCGMLNVSWTASVPATDVAGYTIKVESSTTSYYTVLPAATSATVGRVRLANYVSWDWDIPIVSNAAAAVSMQAYDASGNVSGYTTAVSITPLATITPATPAGLDSTAAVTNTTSGVISLTWNANSEMDASHYYVYRDVFDSGSSIATVLSNSTSYEDTIASANWCRAFEYKIRAASACDPVALRSSESAHALGNGAASGADSPTDTITNTTVMDAVAPGIPSAVTSKAGYRRNFINWSNPSDSDFTSLLLKYDRQCGSTAPATPTSPTSGGTLVEDISNGTLLNEPAGASGRSFTHTGSPALTPSLGEGCAGYIATYAYALFAEDTCGNYSIYNTTSATTVEQCGEEESGSSFGAPRWPGDHYPGAPADNANFLIKSGGGCLDYTFAWDRIKDAYSPVKQTFDLAGFYVYKTTAGSFAYTSGDTKSNTSLIINPAGNPERTELTAGSYPTADDNPDNVGDTFKYYVIPIDCVREVTQSGNPWFTPIVNASEAKPLQSNTLTVSPGRITFSNSLFSPAPANANVVSGGLTFSGSTPTPASGYMHNTVNLRIYNTSKGSAASDVGKATLNNFTAAWSTGAYLDTVKRTDTGGCLFGTCMAGSRSVSPVTISPAIIFNGIDGATCPLGFCSLPLEFKFTDSAGNVSSAQDMRNTTLDISNLSYTKKYKSENTASANGTPAGPSGTYNITCTQADPKITTTQADDVAVPRGPEALAVEEKSTGGLTRVPSQTPDSGTKIPSTQNVVVVADIRDNSAPTPPGGGFSNVWLYQKNTPQGTSYLTPPTSTYSAVTMTETGIKEGNVHIYNSAAIEGVANKNKRVWYYILAKDKEGNWDRDPELANPSTFTAYTYDTDNPCGTTPNPPTGLSFDSDSMTLSWTAPTLNTDNSALIDLAGFYVYQSLNGGAYSLVNTSGPGATSYADTSMATGTRVKYRVAAFDECAPAKVSTQTESTTVYKFGSGAITTATTSISRGGTYYAKYYNITIPANATLTLFLDGISIAATGNDIYMYLLDSANNTLTCDDDSGGSLDAMIIIANGVVTAASCGLLPAIPAGNYIIEVTTYYSGDTGDFILRVTGP